MALLGALEDGAYRLSQALGLVAVLPLLVISVVAIYRLTLHPLAKHPGPLLGRLTDWYGVYHAYKGDSHVHLNKLHHIYGPIVRYGPNRVSVNSNTSLRAIYSYSANARKADDYVVYPANAANPSLHTAIVKSEHGRKRRVISHGFSDSSLRTLEPLIQKNIATFCTQLLAADENGEARGRDYKPDPTQWSPPRDMADWANYLSFDIMGAAVFTESYDVMEHSKNRWVMELIPLAIRHKYISGFMPWIYHTGLINNVFRKLTSQREALRAFTVAQVKARAAAKDSADRNDIFKLLLDAKDPETGQGFKMAELGSEASVMINAGSDTSSTAIAATFFYLVNSPDTLAAATKEVRAAFASLADIKSGTQMNECTYLRACIDESMRLSPPIPSIMPRQAQAGGLAVDGHFFPEGTILGTPAYVVMRNEAYYPDAERFKPSRWIVSKDNTQDTIDVARSAFCPFSIGPRGCIGRGLAYVELTLALARVLWQYDIRLAPGEKADPTAEYPLFDCFITIKKGPMVQFRPRAD